MYRVSVGFIGQLVNVLEGEGLDSTLLCREAGIDMLQLKQPDGFVLQADAFRLMALAAEESDNPNIGLRAYRHFLPGGFHLLAYTMMSSPNLKQALESLVRFSPLLGDGFTIGLVQENGSQRFWGIHHPEEGIVRPRQYEDAGIAAVLGFCHWITGGSLPRLWEVEFTYAEPEDVSEYRQLFGCNLRFGANRNSILFDRQGLLRPLSTANEALALLHGRFAESRIDQLHGTTYKDRVRTLLMERLSLGICDMASIAMVLGISKRSLQRELVREGMPFKEILDLVRRQLADYHLRHSLYSLARVSELLGFMEPSSFHKACLRWFGVSPGRYRSFISEEV
jgi:AraC-like DNA-binding protein